MSVTLPSWIEDRRMDPPQGVVGDSWNWYGTEPTAAKKFLVFHHTVTNPNTDGAHVAQMHVNQGWGGCGYHLVIRHDDHPRGAGIEYVGDLLTHRAGVLNNNPGRVHIALIGRLHEHKPGKVQLELARKLVDYFREPNFVLPSINYYNQVTYHNAQMLNGSTTECPGRSAPWFNDWFNYLKGGSFPEHLYAAPTPPPVPAPVVITPEPAPTPQPVETPVETVDNRPEWERTWTPETIAVKQVSVPAADVLDVTTGRVVKQLPGGEIVQKLAGYFLVQDQPYVRTQWSVDNGKWYGILLSELRTYETPVELPEPQTPVNPGAPVDSIQPPHIDPISAPPIYENYTPAQPAPQKPAMDLAGVIKSSIEVIIGLLLSPLRLAELRNKFRRTK